MSTLVITIPPDTYYYGLYADGLYFKKIFDKNTHSTNLYYHPDSAVFLYYTYPTHRRVYLIRHTFPAALPGVSLPGVSKQVSVIFKQYASRVDKTRRAVSFLNTHHQKNAYGYSDKFYLRLSVLLSDRGKINYTALEALCNRFK
jgi:hypothetical protein